MCKKMKGYAKNEMPDHFAAIATRRRVYGWAEGLFGPRGAHMKTAIKLILLPLMAAVLPAQRPWQQVTVPSLREVAANFKSPPHEYGAIQPFASWNGSDPQEVRARIVRDFDRIAANGIFVVNLSHAASPNTFRPSIWTTNSRSRGAGSGRRACGLP